MFEEITKYIKEFKKGSYGKWHEDKDADGSKEKPFHMPFVIYNMAIYRLEEELLKFDEEHPELEVYKYSVHMEKYGIKWDYDSMANAEVSKVDALCVLGLLVGAFRAERFCDGALLNFCNEGHMLKWLKRLEELDK